MKTASDAINALQSTAKRLTMATDIWERQGADLISVSSLANLALARWSLDKAEKIMREVIRKNIAERKRRGP